ncbi:hypothetical protein SAMN04488563_5986 [Jiangella alkaliphila]|uniref:Uncharacterized protein n=1 Tax=Jiangella alkaliphila TaxID=419479 RepID=A0A1H2LEQ3_9ACTN|nr:hypothetical protein SAMN04488563_5986 [Jiangella alkaliphila]
MRSRSRATAGSTTSGACASRNEDTSATSPISGLTAAPTLTARPSVTPPGHAHLPRQVVLAQCDVQREGHVQTERPQRDEHVDERTRNEHDTGHREDGRRVRPPHHAQPPEPRSQPSAGHRAGGTDEVQDEQSDGAGDRLAADPVAHVEREERAQAGEDDRAAHDGAGQSGEGRPVVPRAGPAGPAGPAGARHHRRHGSDPPQRQRTGRGADDGRDRPPSGDETEVAAEREPARRGVAAPAGDPGHLGHPGRFTSTVLGNSTTRSLTTTHQPTGGDRDSPTKRRELRGRATA